METNKYNSVDRNAVLGVAIEKNPNVECSIINNTLFIADTVIDITTYINNNNIKLS
jgi:hypothetical protein